MNVKKMLNSAQVKELFEKEAILFGERDGVLIDKVIELFGVKATQFANDYSKGWANGFGVGDFTAWYLTFTGFATAATYANVEAVRSLKEVSKNEKKQAI